MPNYIQKQKQEIKNTNKTLYNNHLTRNNVLIKLISKEKKLKVKAKKSYPEATFAFNSKERKILKTPYVIIEGITT